MVSGVPNLEVVLRSGTIDPVQLKSGGGQGPFRAAPLLSHQPSTFSQLLTEMLGSNLRSFVPFLKRVPL